MTNHQILLTAFRALPKRQREALAYHARKGTRVLCGKKAYVFTDGRGGG